MRCTSSLPVLSIHSRFQKYDIIVAHNGSLRLFIAPVCFSDGGRDSSPEIPNKLFGLFP
jgi:hypothetical protein